MKRWTAVMLLIVIVLFGSVIAFNFYKQNKIAEVLANRPLPEFPVTAIKVEGESWTPSIHSIGFIDPTQGVTLEAEQSGKVIAINFVSGQTVEQGELLVELNKAVELANLKSAEGQLPFVKATYERLGKLVKKGNISKEQFDKSNSDYLALIANIESLKATIERLNITAPFSGITGIRDVYLGQYLQAGDQITRLEDTSVMRIRFTIPQTQISQISIGQAVKIFVDAFPKKIFTGQIKAMDSIINPLSGVIELQASIPNSRGQLRSGMFAKIQIVLPEENEQIVVPQSAVTFALYGESVYIIEEVKDKTGQAVNKVKQSVVIVADRMANKVKISSGIKKGDRVVTSGQVRLSNGSRVKVVKSNNLKTPEQLPKL